MLEQARSRWHSLDGLDTNLGTDPALDVVSTRRGVIGNHMQGVDTVPLRSHRAGQMHMFVAQQAHPGRISPDKDGENSVEWTKEGMNNDGQNLARRRRRPRTTVDMTIDLEAAFKFKFSNLNAQRPSTSR